MKRKFMKRLGAAMLALSIFTAVPGNALADTLSDMEAKQTELEQQASDLEAKLESLRDDEAKKREYQETLQQKIDLLQEQIDDARHDIDVLNGNITELTMKLEQSQKEIQDTIDQFKERLVALYKAGNVSTLEILLDSNSFSDFAMRSEMVKTMTAHDEKLMNKIEEYMNNTQAEREECEASKKKVAQLQKDLENDQEELSGLYKENEAAIAELQAAEGATETELEKNAEEREANDQKIKELIEKQKAAEEELRRQQEALAGSSGTIGDGDFNYPTGGGGVEGFNPIWPLPGVSYISAGFNGYPGHKGLDIAGPYGTPVVAAESGTVIEANDYDSWGQSWGYYVLIYHNGTFTTRYAHLSSVAVATGQYVEKGTIVGYEGATGNVTGPHLHFEVYQNGTRVDPMMFL